MIKHYRETYKWGRKKLIRNFPEKNWSPGGLDHLLEKIDKDKHVERKKGSGRPRAQRTKKNEELVQDLILSQEDQPGTHYSKREIADLTDIPKSSVDRIANRDMDVQGFRKIKGQKLDKVNRIKRVARSKRLLWKLTKANIERTFFSDKKLFKLQTPMNTQNNRVYGKRGKKNEISDARLYVKRRAFPKSIMIWAAASKQGKTSVHFVEPRERINGVYYCTKILKKFIPKMRKMCPNFIFHQDGARAHTSAYSLSFIRQRVPEFLEPEMWPPHSPDLNPLDYCLWSYVETAIHKHRNVDDFEQLKREIVRAWNAIPQEVVDNTIDAFRKRLRRCIKVNGGHIEHYKKNF